MRYPLFEKNDAGIPALEHLLSAVDQQREQQGQSEQDWAHDRETKTAPAV
jgi:hypothetical protein